MRGGRFLSFLSPAGASLVLAVALASDVGSPAAFAPERDPATPAQFHFVRLMYNDIGGGFGFRDRWLTDWPEAEYFLLRGIRRLSRIDAELEGERLGIMDERLFDYPWIYAVEVGSWVLSEPEAARLREYFDRGGFLMVDDFHGSFQWEIFEASMRRVFPDRPIVEISKDDSVFHVLYDLDGKTQIPGVQFLRSGRTYEQDGVQQHFRGIYDDKGRLVVVINFNMDLGDSWEHADIPEYAVRYTVLGYQHAINYILYAMTH
jgi:uncharacterized protein DUF4159